MSQDNVGQSYENSFQLEQNRAGNDEAGFLLSLREIPGQAGNDEV
jgi:hypothetical protein